MILCVTLNPCLDKTLTVPGWRPGDNVRGVAVREVVGGKGNNVARALARLGRSTRPATFLGGAVGALCEDLFRVEEGFDPLVVPTGASTREILTVKGPEGEPTAFFDPDPAVTPEEAEALLHAVEAALAGGDVEALTLSGSSPSPATHGLYGDLIALARARKVPAFLDTYGPSLDGIWGFWPELIQLNRREAGLFLRKPNPTDLDLERLLGDWARKGVRVALVTDGPGAVLARIDGRATGRRRRRSCRSTRSAPATASSPAWSTPTCSASTPRPPCVEGSPPPSPTPSSGTPAPSTRKRSDGWKTG